MIAFSWYSGQLIKLTIIIAQVQLVNYVGNSLKIVDLSLYCIFEL